MQRHSFVWALAVIAALGIPGAALADNSPGPNAFALPPDSVSDPLASGLRSEDLANPFVEAHGLEQDVYSTLYRTKYDDTVDAKLRGRPLPPLVDADGRPLWFDQYFGFGMLSELVQHLFKTEQFDNLDRLFADWNDGRELTADGRWKLTTLDNGLQATFEDSRDWDADWLRIRHWRAKSPKSPAAALAEATYWHSYAWQARGSGYANSVTPEGWALFQERLKKSEAALLDSRPFASASPLWLYQYLGVGADLGWPSEQLVTTLASDAEYDRPYTASYLVVVRHLAPKWGGDWRLVDEFVRHAVERTKGALGRSMYARLYLAVSPCDCEGGNLFEETQANWPELKSSFEDMVRLYPHSGWNMNQFAAYACMAGDEQAYLVVRARLGNAVLPEAWTRNYPPELCDRKYSAQPL